MFTISPTSPGVTLIAAVITPIVVLLLITVVAIPVIAMCLCRKRGNELQEQSVYYSEVGLPELPPLPKTLKRAAEPQCWTIANIKESQTKPPSLHRVDDTDFQPRPTCHEAEANHNHAVQEHTTCTTAITVPFMENQACRNYITQQVSSRNEVTTKPAHGADIALTEDVETNANIAYSCNDVTFAVTDNPAYSTDIAIAPYVSTQENVAYSITLSQSVCDDDVANITGSHGDSYGSETATMIPLTDIHPAHCTSVAIAPDILENSESLSTTRSTAITVPLTENQACRTEIAQRVSSRNEFTTKPAHGDDIATEDVEINANIAYSCNYIETFAVTDNTAYIQHRYCSVCEYTRKCCL